MCSCDFPNKTGWNVFEMRSSARSPCKLWNCSQAKSPRHLDASNIAVQGQSGTWRWTQRLSCQDNLTAGFRCLPQRMPFLQFARVSPSLFAAVILLSKAGFHTQETGGEIGMKAKGIRSLIPLNAGSRPKSRYLVRYERHALSPLPVRFCRASLMASCIQGTFYGCWPLTSARAFLWLRAPCLGRKRFVAWERWFLKQKDFLKRLGSQKFEAAAFSRIQKSLFWTNLVRCPKSHFHKRGHHHPFSLQKSRFFGGGLIWLIFETL